MQQAQSGVFSEPCQFGWFLEFDVADVDGAIRDLQSVRELCAVVAFGPGLWARLSTGWTPPGLSPFTGVDGNPHSAPATEADLLVWIAADDFAQAHDDARAVTGRLAGHATVVDETLGFDYRGSHDLIGFEDGTANPKPDARAAAAQIPKGEVGTGGSFVFTQKWVHDLAAFGSLTVAEQERVVGRTKADSIELEGAAMPADSHVSRTDLAVAGVAQKIWRRSMPYGTPARHGLYFFAFACALSRIQVQLDSMYDVAGTGTYDRLLDYSQAVTGAYWFAPSAADLDTLLGG